MPESGSELNFPAVNVLRFTCAGCQSGLEVAVAFAGVEAPCPLCGIPVRAPWHGADYGKPLGLIPLPKAPPGSPPGASPGPEAAAFEPGNRSAGPPTEQANHPAGREWTREMEEAAAGDRHRRRVRHLRIFDAGLGLLCVGMLALGSAALAFTEPKADALPKGPPELSRLVLERMQQLDRQRDQAVQSARASLVGLLGAQDSASATPLFLPGFPGEADLAFPVFPGMVPDDFEFIQARRIPGTDRFLTIFEVITNSPLVVPVEETAAGSRIHGHALVQQMGGRLGKFFADQGAGEAVFYVLLRPAPASMAAELLRNRPDLKPFQLVAVEPAFPADGAASCLVCLAPLTAHADIFARRAHDSGLRPAVVKLAWRQHRESGNFVELTGFQPNAWSRH